jgi:cytochrome o ubiquinol oxidase subunit 2
VIVATALMLLIIVPVMALTVAFAWRYRRPTRRRPTRPTGTIPPSWNW